MVDARTPSASAPPLVTVCLPTIGRMEYLETALRSLAEQDYPAYEVLILDNASPADARALVARFAAEHANVRVLRVDDRVPMFANFNRGIAAARGEYVAFFHDDDVYQPTFLARYVEALERHPGAGLAGGNFDVIDGAGRVSRRQRVIAETTVISGHDFIRDTIRKGRCDFSTPGIVFRRGVLERFGFDESIPVNWGDLTVLMRMAETCDVVLVAEPLYSWRVHGQNGSSIPFSRSIPIRTGVLRAYLEEFLGRYPGEARRVGELEGSVRRGHRRGLFWGWLAAPTDVEATACLEVLGASAAEAPFVRALALLDRLGFSPARRRRLLPGIRRLVDLVGA